MRCMVQSLLCLIKSKCTPVRERMVQPVEMYQTQQHMSGFPLDESAQATRRRIAAMNTMFRCHGIKRSDLTRIHAACVQLGCAYNDPFQGKTRAEFLKIHDANRKRSQRAQQTNGKKRKRDTEIGKARSKRNAQNKKGSLLGRIKDAELRKIHEECILFDCIHEDPRNASDKKSARRMHVKNRMTLMRRKKIFDGAKYVPHPPIDFSSFHDQPNPTKKKLEAFYRAEGRMFRLQHMFCPNCHQRRLSHMETNQKKAKQGCHMCDCCKKNSVKYTAANSALPIWKDSLTGKICYHVPEVLRNLTTGEKMLIQKVSPVVPLVHIKNGTFGIKGHVCALPQHIDSVCTDLPRTKCKIVRVLKTGMAKDGTLHSKYFKIRKKNVLSALHWLKEHSNAYKDINIREENLDWMEGASEADLKDVIDFDTYFNEAHNFDKGPAPQQVFPDDTVDQIESSGILSDKNATIASEMDEDILDSLKKTCIDNTDTRHHINWPRIETEAIEEKSEKIFCMAFPWLFPGGVGDINDAREISLTPKEWAKNLIYYGDGRFQEDELFPFYALDFITR